MTASNGTDADDRRPAASPSLFEWELATGEVRFSDEWKRRLGHAADEVPDRLEEWERRVHPEDAGPLWERVRAYLEDPSGPLAVEHRLRHRDGSYRWYRLDAGLVRDAAGRPVRMVGVHVDVTGARRVEEELLERLGRLETANRELARAVRARDELLCGMSHDLKGPLGAILGMAEQILEEPAGAVSPRHVKMVRLIEASGQRLLALVTDLVELARIDAGRVAADPARCPLRDAGEAAIRRFQGAAAEKRQQLTLTVDPPDLVAETDLRLLAQLLSCLLSNAVKLNPEGGRLGLDVTGDRAARLVRLVVRDDGVGLAAADLEQLLEAFVELDGRLEKVHGGTGLGLALAHRLTRLLGGSIEARSEPGPGSRFTVQLPWSPPAGVADPGAGGPAQPGEAAAGVPAPHDGPSLASRIPEGLREALRVAILRADAEEISALAGRLAAHDPGAADAVRGLAESFEYDTLLGRLGAGR